MLLHLPHLAFRTHVHDEMSDGNTSAIWGVCTHPMNPPLVSVAMGLICAACYATALRVSFLVYISVHPTCDVASTS